MNDNLDKENYRIANVLPYLSKLFERVMYTQIESFVEDKLSKLPTRFNLNFTRITRVCQE